MAYFKPSYGVNGLGIPMGPMDAATLHHSMGYATGEKLFKRKRENMITTREKVSYFITRQIFNILILNLFLLFLLLCIIRAMAAKQFFHNSTYSI